MESVFDFYSFTLMLVSIGLFVVRYIRENPPVYPYLIIACTCFVGNALGEAGGGIYALTLLVAASFSFLGCLLYPKWRSMSSTKKKAEKVATTESVTPTAQPAAN